MLGCLKFKSEQGWSIEEVCCTQISWIGLARGTERHFPAAQGYRVTDCPHPKAVSPLGSTSAFLAAASLSPEGPDFLSGESEPRDS